MAMENEELITALENITHFSKKFPGKEFEIICRNQEKAVPHLLNAVRKALEEKDELPEDYQLHFYALFLLAQFGVQEAFPLVIGMASLPSEVVDGLIGDAVTDSLGDILYSTYNGDEELLLSFIKNADAYDYCRAEGLNVVNQLYFDGIIDKDRMISILKELIYELPASEEGYFDTEIMGSICDCHLIEMLPDVRFLLNEDRIDESVRGGYEECIDRLFQYGEDYRIGCSKITDAADCLRNWAMFDQPGRQDGALNNRDFDKLMKNAIREMNRPEKKVKIGRNDPCPCGSGKKYKFCCMNKPSAQDMIESEAEQAKWLKDYPETGVEHLPGRIYLDEYFDAESIAIDKLVYLALKHRPGFLTQRETEEQMEQRQAKYLWKAFELYSEKSEKEGLKDPKEYDARHMIHYSAVDWLPYLLELLKKQGMTEKYKTVRGYLGHKQAKR